MLDVESRVEAMPVEIKKNVVDRRSICRDG